jgi:hypothetical protein
MGVSIPLPWRLGVLAISSLACGGSAGKPAAAGVAAAHVTASPGVDLVMACTPAGPELCFNAIDDNCNGIIDEGCGVTTGLLQFVIAWGDSPADVDLVLTTPNGETVNERARESASGFHLERDCPQDGCNGQNRENIYFDGDDPPRGHYVVEVRLGDLNKAELPVRVRFGARVGGRSFGADVVLSHEEEKKTFGFDL